MTGTRRHLRAMVTGTVAVALVAALTAPIPAAHAEPAAGVDWSALVPSADSLATVAAALPDDPVAAAEHLVDLVWGDDSLTAVAATGEILRRAGMPLVSADGPVVALPDGNVIADASILVEFLPTLTDAARTGVGYPPDQVAGLLEFFGFAAPALTARKTVAMLAAWGKADGDIAEARNAGASARALARMRGELLIPATVPTREQEEQLADDPGALPPDVLSWLTAPTEGSGPVDGTESGTGSGRVIPVLSPPSPPADRQFAANGDTAKALAAMPGLYGLPLLHTLVRDDHIEITATGDCPTVLEVLQSGQWAVEAVPDTDPQASQVRGPDDDATHLARLRLADQTSFVRLTESPGECTGSITLPGS